MTGQGFYLVLNRRDTGGTTYQQYLGQVARGQSGIGKSSLYRLSGLLYQIVSQLVKFCSRQIHVKMLRTICRSGNEGQVDVGGRSGRQLFLRLLGSLFQTLHCHLVAGQIHALFALKLGNHPVNDLLVEVIAAQTVVSCCSQNLNNAVADLDDRHIEGTAAKVVYHDLLLFLIVQSISQSGCRRLVDDTLYIQSGNLTCVLGRLTLCVVKVRGNGNYRFRYLLAQVILRIALQFLKNHSGNLLRRIFLSVDGSAVIGTHISLDGRNRVLSVGYRLTFCRLADQTLSVLCESHYRRCRPRAFLVCDNRRLSTFHNCHAAVCCSQINSNNLSHDVFPPEIFFSLF